MWSRCALAAACGLAASCCIAAALTPQAGRCHPAERAELAAAVPPPALPIIRPGAVEIGVAASMTSVLGATSGAFAVRGGSFAGLGPGRAGFEIEPAYTHIGELDLLDLQAALSWQPATGRRWDHAFVALAGGVRQEWLGSFEQARYPLGCNLGLRAAFGERAAMRAEYRFRRILRDPVADHNEHRLVLGLSLFLRNGTRPGAS